MISIIDVTLYIRLVVVQIYDKHILYLYTFRSLFTRNTILHVQFNTTDPTAYSRHNTIYIYLYENG